MPSIWDSCLLTVMYLLMPMQSLVTGTSWDIFTWNAKTSFWSSFLREFCFFGITSYFRALGMMATDQASEHQVFSICLSAFSLCKGKFWAWLPPANSTAFFPLHSALINQENTPGLCKLLGFYWFSMLAVWRVFVLGSTPNPKYNCSAL